MGAWDGETPAALTSMETSPRSRAKSMSARMESRSARSTPVATASKPACSRVAVMAAALSGLLSATTIVLPAPMRRAMAMPICPAPVRIMTCLPMLISAPALMGAVVDGARWYQVMTPTYSCQRRRPRGRRASRTQNRGSRPCY